MEKMMKKTIKQLLSNKKAKSFDDMTIGELKESIKNKLVDEDMGGAYELITSVMEEEETLVNFFINETLEEFDKFLTELKDTGSITEGSGDKEDE